MPALRARHRPVPHPALRPAPPPLPQLTRQATTALATLAPHLSAAHPAPVGQIAMMVGLGLATVVALLLAPGTVLGAAHAAALTGFTLLAAVRVAAALTPLPAPTSAPALQGEPPLWTVLVALYREADVLPGLLAALDRLDWPHHRLEILLLIEDDDHDTRAALSALNLRPPFRTIIVPPGNPRTKPRALNVGLGLARGAYVTVYDAEDRPAARQLREAWRSLTDRAAPARACVQAPLSVYNDAEGWLPAQFALEYAIQFHVLVPALVRFGWPVPLGGTSNHFRTTVLRAVGGWDPYNVTEDADLGIRLARAGWQTGYITAPTLEEAPPRLGAWLRQRSRWIKGHAQTLGVHTRHPASTLRQLGPGAMFGLVATLGGAVVSSLLHAPLALGAVVATTLGILPQLDAAVLLLGIGSGWLAAVVAARRTGRPELLVAALTMPLYWPLQTLAAVKALHGLAFHPFSWDKTDHGPAARRRPETKRPWTTT